MKKGIWGILLCLYIIAAMLPDSVSAMGIVSVVNITVDEPAAGKRPATKASISKNASTEAQKVEWEGDFDADGCFVEGRFYTVHIHVYMKADMDKMFSQNVSNIRATVNSEEGNASVERVTDTHIIVSRIFAVGGREAFPYVSIKELKPGDYGTALVGDLFIRGYKSMDDSWYNIEFTLMKGDMLQIDAAYLLGEGVWPNWVEVSANGMKGYVLVYDPDKYSTPSAWPLTDIIVEGNRPVVVKPKEAAIMGVSRFDVEPGKMPKLGPERFKEGYSNDECVVESITYSPNAPCEPYTRVTATVTYRAKDGYIFPEDCQSTSPYTKSLNRVDETTVEVTYIGYVGSGGTDLVTDEMYDDGQEQMRGSDFAIVATGTICVPVPTGKAPDYSQYYLYQWPTMSGKRTNGRSSPGRLRCVTEKIEIIDLHAERMYSNVAGNWYRVSCGNVVGYIPAAWVDNVELTGCWDGAPAVDKESPYVFAGGSGTPEDPYLIATPEQLDAVRRGMGRSYKLIADIDLSDWGNWIPIGSNPAYGGYMNAHDAAADKGNAVFTGTFDGDGHVISGMTIVDHRDDLYMVSPWATRVYGLFAKISDQSDTSDTLGGRYEDGEEARIKNLGIVNFTIDLSYKNISEKFSIYAAPLFGSALAVFKNCYSAGGSIRIACGGAQGGTVRASGLGVLGSSSVFEDCYNTSSIHITKYNDFDMVVNGAGILVESDFSWIVNCFNTGDITVPFGLSSVMSSASGICGGARIWYNRGIIGTAPKESSAIYNCYNTGNLTGSGAYGIAGFTQIECYIKNCYNVGKLTGDKNPLLGETADHMSPRSPVYNYGTKYVCDNGVKVVSGNMWKNSKKLGRKVLKSIPEDAIKVPAAKKAIYVYDFKISDIKKKTYTGKALTPAVTVTYKGKKLVEGKDYTLGYSKNVEPGNAAVTVYGLGAYKGAIAKTFYITPAKVEGLTGASDGKKTVTLNWTKNTKGNGYIIEYSLDKNFKEGVKKVTITSKSTATEKISGLTSGKTYYFRICAYKTEGVEGPYCKAVAVKVK